MQGQCGVRNSRRCGLRTKESHADEMTSPVWFIFLKYCAVEAMGKGVAANRETLTLGKPGKKTSSDLP